MKHVIQHITRSVRALCVLALAWSCAVQEKTSRSQPKEQIRRAQPEVQINHLPPPPKVPTVLVRSSMSGMNLISKEGKVDASLLAFLDLFGITHDGTVESINKAMQANFLRKPRLERRDLQDTKEDLQVKKKAIVLLSRMGLVKEIPHSIVNADYFLLFGAMIGAVERRFVDFVQQYTQGTLRCKNVVLLGGVRKLCPHEIQAMESYMGKQALATFLQQVDSSNKEEPTEYDLLQFLWKKHATEQMKKDFRKENNLFFVNCTNTKKGTNERPTTQTTLEAWYETCQPEPGSCHANVEQPYAMRMEKVLRLLLEKKSQELGDTAKRFSITWNSPKASERVALAVYKDELARTFYMELMLKRFMETQK